MADTLSPAMVFEQDDFHPPQATVSLSETSLEMAYIPSTPESLYVKDENDPDGQDETKPTKKRKSWGQELPTPKTNLPPRKRAKTEDEKEQRRIERVLRNRQAAQSSRERKRQEVEKLEGEKSAIEQQNELLKERLMAVEHEKFLLAQKVAKMTAQMKVFKQGSSTSTPDPSSPTMAPTDQFDRQKIKQEMEMEFPFALPTPQQSLGHATSSFASPSTMTYSPSLSPATVGLGLDDSLTASPDMTQHPAAMFLFAVDAAPSDDLPFFKNGFSAPSAFEPDNNDNPFNGNDFTFDSMVDLDAGESYGGDNDNSNHINIINNGTSENTTDHNDDTLARDSNDYLLATPFFETFDPPSLNAATSSAQQPFLGAPA